MFYANHTLKFGLMVSAITDDGKLAGLWFKNQKYFPLIPGDAQWVDTPTEPIPQGVMALYQQLEDQLKAYEEGELRTFNLPLKLEGTAFRLKVWKALQAVPYGQTLTYGELGVKVRGLKIAKGMGQAIGGAVGHNPFSIIIPCHRVVGAKGQLTGYAGGLEKKQALLNHEKASTT